MIFQVIYVYLIVIFNFIYQKQHMDPTATLTLDDLDGEFDPETVILYCVY